MPSKKKILAISGSTRKNSTNENILRFIAAQTEGQFDVIFYSGLTSLPHFNPDLDNDTVDDSVTEFRRLVAEANGVLICTPEYVFSLPGSLKNAIEWTVSTTVFSDKPTAIIVASGLGEKTFQSLALIMKTVGASIAENAALLITGARAKMVAGKITDEETSQNIQKLITAFINSMGE